MGDMILEEDNAAELIRDLTEENQTRKILGILNECTGLEEAKQKVRDLLTEYK